MVVFNNRIFIGQEGGVATTSGTGTGSTTMNTYNNPFMEAMARSNGKNPHEISQEAPRMSLPLQKLGVRLPPLRLLREILTF